MQTCQGGSHVLFSAHEFANVFLDTKGDKLVEVGRVNHLLLGETLELRRQVIEEGFLKGVAEHVYVTGRILHFGFGQAFDNCRRRERIHDVLVEFFQTAAQVGGEHKLDAVELHLEHWRLHAPSINGRRVHVFAILPHIVEQRVDVFLLEWHRGNETGAFLRSEGEDAMGDAVCESSNFRTLYRTYLQAQNLSDSVD